MANYKHGVYISETGTSLIPTVRVESALPFVVGTAPVNQVLAANRKVNDPVLINSYAEAVQYFGFEPAQVFNADTGDKKFRFSINEFMYANFNFYGIVPCIFVNVLDPSVHKVAVEAQTVTIKDGSGTLNILGVLAETLVVTNGQTGDDLVTYVAGTDYETAFDENGYLVIYDYFTITEIENFEDKSGNGNYAASYGHDDIVMTLAQIPLLEQTAKYKQFCEDMEEYRAMMAAMK